MVSGDSKHEPVKPLHSLLDVTPLELALSAKCTIHDVSVSLFIFQSVFLSFLLHSQSVRWQDILFCNFWSSVGSCELQMCMAFGLAFPFNVSSG